MGHDRDESTFGLAVGAIAPIVVAALLVAVRDVVLNANVALALVVVVVGAAAIGGRGAGMVAALTAALSYNFFHTQPYLSLAIDSEDDVETTVLLLIVGVVVGNLASRARRARASIAAGRDEIRRIHRVAEQVAAGQDTRDVIMAAQTELTGLLTLESCRFEAPPYRAALPRMERSGAVHVEPLRYANGGFELPHGGAELPVLARGQQVGRFVLMPTPGVGASLEQRVVAVALADQVGGAIAAGRPPAGRRAPAS